MSKRVYELFLFDIYIALLKIKFVSNKFTDAESLKYDFVSWDSILREFEIIGESTNILIKNHYLTKEHQVVVDFRNLLIHHYFGIDADEIWDVIQNDLHPFRKIILEKIKNIDTSLKKELIDALIQENKHITFIVKELLSL
jgi:uncharacterized protein with HEPN domain